MTTVFLSHKTVVQSFCKKTSRPRWSSVTTPEVSNHPSSSEGFLKYFFPLRLNCFCVLHKTYRKHKNFAFKNVFVLIVTMQFNTFRLCCCCCCWPSDHCSPVMTLTTQTCSSSPPVLRRLGQLLLVLVVPLALAHTHLLNVQVFSGFVDKLSDCYKN